MFFGINYLNAQFFEDFSDNDLSINPEWLGSLDNFIVNDLGQLQLQAASAGQTSLFTSFELEPNFQWDIDFELDFAPSASNTLQIYLFTLSADLDSPFAYFIKIGETGSDDALELINAFDGNTIARGVPGRVADPFEMKLRVVLSDEGQLDISSQLSGEDVFISEISVSDIAVPIGDSFFGLVCRYSSTRADKFNFRTIELNSPTSDESPPQLLDIIEADANLICLRFNETINEELSNEEVLISIAGEFIDELMFTGREIKFNYDSSGSSGPLDISITGVSDNAGNRIDTMAQLVKEIELQSGNLLINELLFDPVPGGDDFVELINTTDQTIDLQGLRILNTVNGRSIEINSTQLIEPFGILAFGEDKDQILSMYKSANASLIVEHDLPDFSNNSGNVTIVQNSIEIDAFDYSDDLHHDLLDETEGVSLERRTVESNSDESGVWTSASESAGFATPGLENSSSLLPTMADVVSFSDDSFSPNDDGDNDELEITIVAGFESVGSIWIYDQAGNLLIQLRSNSLLGSQDVISWDGTLEDGRKAPIGIYIIRVEVFDTKGQVYSFKKAVALVDFID